MDVNDPPSPTKYTAAYWRALAADAHARADDLLVYSKVQLLLLEIARIYDVMADHEAKVEGGPKEGALEQ